MSIPHISSQQNVKADGCGHAFVHQMYSSSTVAIFKHVTSLAFKFRIWEQGISQELARFARLGPVIFLTTHKNGEVIHDDSMVNRNSTGHCLYCQKVRIALVIKVNYSASQGLRPPRPISGYPGHGFVDGSFGRPLLGVQTLSF